MLAYAAALLIPGQLNAVLPGLDHSWGFALNHFIHTDFRFGPDLVFTYGPLGFVAAPEHVSWNLEVAMAVRAIVWGLLIWELAAVWRSGRRVAAVALVLGLIFSNKIYIFYWDYAVVATTLIVLARARATPRRPGVLLPIAAALLATLFLVKFTGFLLAELLFGVHALDRWLSRPRPGAGESIALGAVFFSGPLAYLVYNPSLSGLLLYIRGSLEIGSGYAESMSLDPYPAALRFGVLLCMILAGAALYGLWRRLLPPAAAILVAAAAYTVFRHSFVRADQPHIAIFFCFSILMLAVLLAQMKLEAQHAAPSIAALIVFGVVALFGVHHPWTDQPNPPATPQVPWWLPDYNWRAARDLVLHPAQTLADLDRQSATWFDDTPAQKYAPLIHGRRVLVFPWNMAYAAMGGFELVPLYATQAYSAYTRFLDERSGEKIRNADDVIFEWQSINGRNPVFDTPAIWTALFAGYSPRDRTEDSLLLARREHPLSIAYRPISTESFAPDRWASIPRRATPVAMSVDLQPTPWGRLAIALYTIPPVFLEARTMSGRVESFRAIAPTLTEPSPINCLPFSFAAVDQLWSENIAADPVVAVRLKGAGLDDLRASAYTFYGIEGTEIRVAESAGQYRDASQQRKDKPAATPATSIRSALGGFIDTWNGKPIPKANDPQQPVHLARAQAGVVEGWVVSTNAETVMDEVYGFYSGGRISAQIVPRPDVAKYLHNEKLRMCGYRLALEPGVLQPGLQAIKIVGHTRADDKYYKLPAVLYVYVD